MKQVAKALLAPAFALSMIPAALAEYPEGPVEFLVPFPPGDLEDVLTRMIADDFQAEYGQPAAVINRPGGGGGPFPGAVEVAMAPADGSVIGSFVIDVPLVGDQLGIPQLDPMPFEPIGIFLSYPFVIATSADAPFQSMQELAAHARNNDVTLGHFGTELVSTSVTLALGGQMNFPWASDAAFDALDCNSLASGDVDVVNTTIQLIKPCLDDVTVLAALTPERLELAPNAPTIEEIEPDLAMTMWNGLYVHQDTPADVRNKIARVARETVRSERAQEFAAETGAQIYWLNAEEADAQLKQDQRTQATIEKVLNE